MHLQPYEVANDEVGQDEPMDIWRWTLTQEREELNDNSDPEAPTTVTVTEIVGHSCSDFKTKDAALENAKYAALGILDALASWAIGETESTALELGAAIRDKGLQGS